MRDLFRHLRTTHHLGAYFLLLFRRHRHVLAYLLLAVATAYAVYGVQSQNATDSRQATEQRGVIAEAGVNAVKFGCVRDYNTIRQLRKIILDGDRQVEQYVREGTLTKKQARRSHRNTNKALRKLPLPDCEAIAKAYAAQVGRG